MMRGMAPSRVSQAGGDVVEPPPGDSFRIWRLGYVFTAKDREGNL